MIVLEHINKKFTDGKLHVEAVKDVSLTIYDGEIFGIIGFSGAGKSTLVRCINLLERPTSGKVVVNDLVMTELKPKELRAARQKIGMIFQHFNLMPSRTVFDNVAYPLKGRGLSKSEIAEKVRRLLTLVEISDKEAAYPSQLSGGQKQRVAIARALANDPNILLCDEATSALDPQTTNALLALLKRLNKELGLTIVIITHEMAVIKKICHRVAVMEKGTMIEYGNVFDIFTAPKNPLTKDFIATTSNLSKAEELIEPGSQLLPLDSGDVFVRLSFVRKGVFEPLITDVSELFHIKMNMILADIEIVDEAPIGGSVVIMHGSAENIQKAIAYIESRNVKVEVLKHA